MYISRLVLKHYKRLMLSNIQSFEWTPKSNLMVILGSNGSGKSSVLEELTPLPSHHENFVKPGGIKAVELTHQERQYKLVSTYERGTGSHSFIVDGEELNPGGTMAVQRQLVEEHFRIDRGVHELAIGLRRFSLMSTKERREWLTRLSPMNLDYAFSQYNKVRSLHRDHQGVIKHLTKRMANENIDLPDDAELARQRGHIEQLTEQLNTLFQARGPEIKARFASNESCVGQLLNLVHRGKDLLKQYPTLVMECAVNSRDAYLVALNDLNAVVKSHETMLDHFMLELHELEVKEPLPAEMLSEAELTTLREQVQTLAAECETRVQQVQRYQGQFPLVTLDYDNPVLEGRLGLLFERWSVLLNSFPANEDGRFNPQAGREANEEFRQLKAHRLALENEQIQVSRRLATIKGCPTITCPQCAHGFQPGIDQHEVNNLEQRLTPLGERIERVEARLKALEHYLEEFTEYSGFVAQFRQLCQDFADFQPLWDYCIEHRVMYVAPKRYTTDAVNWYTAMEEQIRAGRQQLQLKRLQHKLALAEAVDRDALGFMQRKRDDLQQAIEGRTHQLNDVRRAQRQAQQSGKQLEDFEAAIHQMIQRFEGFYSEVNIHLKHLQQQGVNAEISALQMQLAETRQYLSRLELREHTLRELEVEHKHAVDRHADLNLLTKALSPNDGLIGRYLMGFMQALVGLMNDVIREVWSHPLEVLPSKVDSDELTYLFPLNVNEGAVIAPDIARGSAGQRDIVDFAFKVLAMRFLGLENYPLHLDEFGSTFDEAHRHNLVPFLLQLVELNAFNQIFFVSHFAATHGAFNHAEYLVVDAANVTVPARYNVNVIMG